MSWQASSWVLKQRIGNPILKLLLLAAANYADPDGRCWPKVDQLAVDSEVSRRTIQRKLMELQELGFIRVTPRYDGSKQKSSLIEILMEDVRGVTVSPLTDGGVTELCHPRGDTTLSPTDSLNNHKNKQSMSSSKKKDDGTYTEEFEAVWLLAAGLGAPRTRNTSKKKAYDNWRMLNSEKQEQVRGAIPTFAAAMRAEARPEDKIPHFEFWLSKRIYETVSAPPAAAAKAVLVDWHKTAKREQWIKVLPHWRENYGWNPVWGPAPGKPGCMLPEDLLTELEKYQIILDRDGRKAAEAAMKDGSQLRDAINAAHRAA